MQSGSGMRSRRRFFLDAAARRNRLRTSRNLTLGSALASIGFTIPAVAIISLFAGWTLFFGLDAEGAVHLVIFAVYLFTVLVP